MAAKTRALAHVHTQRSNSVYPYKSLPTIRNSPIATCKTTLPSPFPPPLMRPRKFVVVRSRDQSNMAHARLLF